MMAFVVTAAIAYASDGDRQPRTPVCREVHATLKEGGKKRDVTALLEGAEDITAEDVACLGRERLPGYVGRKAQAQLVKRHGVEALPTAPVDVWAVVPDPCAIASAQGLTMEGVGGTALCLFGGREYVARKVSEKILTDARAALAAEGVAAEVGFRVVPLPAVSGTSWEGAQQRTSTVAAGNHYVLHIHIPDAVAAARASKGDFVVGLGARVGMDIAATVRDTVRQQVWSQLAAHGVTSVLIEPE